MAGMGGGSSGGTVLLPYMIIPAGAGQTVNELDGQSSLSSLEVDCIDPRGELKKIMADPHALGAEAIFLIGFEGECLGDFTPLHTMTLTDVGWTAAGMVKFAASDLQRALFDQIWLYGGPYQLWKADTVYAQGALLIDANGNVQQAVFGGASGSVAPVWQQSEGQLTFDGTVFNRWAADTSYLAGAKLRDPAGSVQQSGGGVSGPKEPFWNEGLGGLTQDGVPGSYFFWTNEGPELTWRNRGQLQPPLPCFAANANFVASSNPRWLQGNPIDIALVAYQNEVGIGQLDPTNPSSWTLYDPITGDGLINPNPLLDVPGLLALRDNEFSGVRFEFKLTSAQTAKDWVENEILKPLGLYHIVRADGSLSFKSMKSPASQTGLALSRDHVVGIPTLTRWPIVNYLTARFDAQDPNLGQSNTAASSYASEFTFIDAASADQFSQFFKQTVEAAGLRIAWNGYNLSWRQAQRVFARHAFGTPIYEFQAHLTEVVRELGDLVSFTHALLPDLETGALGLSAVLCEVTDKQPNYASALITFKLADTRFMNYTKPFQIADHTVPDWTDATIQQRATYLFVANSSGKNPDGSAANTIF